MRRKVYTAKSLFLLLSNYETTLIIAVLRYEQLFCTLAISYLLQTQEVRVFIIGFMCNRSRKQTCDLGFETGSSQAQGE